MDFYQLANESYKYLKNNTKFSFKKTQQEIIAYPSYWLGNVNNTPVETSEKRKEKKTLTSIWNE